MKMVTWMMITRPLNYSHLKSGSQKSGKVEFASLHVRLERFEPESKPTNGKENKYMTKHRTECTRVWKKYDIFCPRCIELSKGAKPRTGWQTDYYNRKAEARARFKKNLREHDCSKSNCGVVCTAFEW